MFAVQYKRQLGEHIYSTDPARALTKCADDATALYFWLDDHACAKRDFMFFISRFHKFQTQVKLFHSKLEINGAPRRVVISFNFRIVSERRTPDAAADVGSVRRRLARH